MTYFANQMLLAYKSKRNTAMSATYIKLKETKTAIRRTTCKTELSQQNDYVIIPCRTPLTRNRSSIRVSIQQTEKHYDRCTQSMFPQG